MTTYYDILGVVPGADDIDLAVAYKTRVLAQFDEAGYDIQRFEHSSSMWRGQRINRIAELTTAYQAINNDDKRTIYHKKLAAAGLVCSLCDGKGRIQYGKGTFVRDTGCTLQCEACKGTGKGFEIEA